MHYWFTLVLLGIITLPAQCRTVPSESVTSKNENENIYWLYTIPTLEVKLFYDKSYAGNNEMSKLDDLLKIGHDLDSITTDFLFDEIKQSLLDQQSTQELHTLQLDVVVRLASQDRNRRNLRTEMTRQRATTSTNSGDLILMFEAEVSGHAALSAPTDHNSGSTSKNADSDEELDIDRSLVKKSVKATFANEASRKSYLLKIQYESEISLLNDVKDLQIIMQAHETIENEQAKQTVRNKNDESNGFSSAESAAVFAMGAALIVFVGGSYVFLSNQYHSRRKRSDRSQLYQDNVSLMKDIDSKSEIDGTVASTPGKSSSYDMDRSFETETTMNSPSLSSKNSDSSQSSKSSPSSIPTCASSHPDHNGTGGNTNLVPVPLRQNKTETMFNKSVPARRYVQSTSPFDVLYGAAFLHHDHERVQKSFGLKANRPEKSRQLHNNSSKHANTSKEKKSNFNDNTRLKNHKIVTTPSRKKKFTPKKPNTPITPMMSIAETDEGSDSTASRENQNTSYAFFPQIMNNITMYLGDKKYMSSGSNDSSSTSSQRDEIMAASKDDLIVYRDFPRHDGTPFVMFTPQNEGKENGNGDVKIPPQVCFNQEETFVESLSMASDSLASSMNSSLKEGIDSFVDKLEKLMAARSRQYEERVKMEREREKRRKERKSKRPHRRRDRDRNRSVRYQAVDKENSDEKTDAKNKQITDRPTKSKANNDATNHFGQKTTNASKLTSQIDDLLALISDGAGNRKNEITTAGKMNGKNPTIVEESPDTDLISLNDPMDIPDDEIPVNKTPNAENPKLSVSESQDPSLQKSQNTSSTTSSVEALSSNIVTPEKAMNEDVMAPEDELTSTNNTGASSITSSVSHSIDQNSVDSDNKSLPISENDVESIQHDKINNSNMNELIKSNTSSDSMLIFDVIQDTSPKNTIESPKETTANEKTNIVQSPARDNSETTHVNKMLNSSTDEVSVSNMSTNSIPDTCVESDDTRAVIDASSSNINNHKSSTTISLENGEDENNSDITEHEIERNSEKFENAPVDTIAKTSYQAVSIVSGEIPSDDIKLDGNTASDTQFLSKTDVGGADHDELEMPLENRIL